MQAYSMVMTLNLMTCTVSGFARTILLVSFFMIMISVAQNASADDPVVLDARAEVQPNSLYAFSVTIQHPDTGWTHYADGWEIISSTGQPLGARTLYHPHGNNEPFTRSLANIAAPIGESTVTIRANCTVDGPAADVFVLQLPPR